MGCRIQHHRIKPQWNRYWRGSDRHGWNESGRN